MKVPALTKDQVVSVVNFTHNLYGHDRTCVLADEMQDYLPVLRALEAAGLVAIREVTLNKRWVCTAAGAIWRHMDMKPKQDEFSIDRDFLIAPAYGWMSSQEAFAAAQMLAATKLIVQVDGFSVYSPLRESVPGAQHYPRFYRAPDPMERYR